MACYGRSSAAPRWRRWFIPYGDPAPTHRFKNVFDMGEYGVGRLANSLTLGCDCLGDITYMDGVVNDQDGNGVTIANAICLHEEDAGIGWKHTDFRTEEVEVRRLRRFVVSMIATVGNYEYGFFWYLYTDGTIEFEVKLSGVISTGALPEGERPGHGVLVAPGLYGPHHQHFFCVRLDMEVDGERNTVVEVDSEPCPVGPENPAGTAWVTKRNVLRSESEAQRTGDQMRGRYWRVENPGVVNGVGDPVAYKLMPGETVMPMCDPDGQHGRPGPDAVDQVAFERQQPGLAQHKYREGELDGRPAPAMRPVDRQHEQRPAVLQVGDRHHANDAEDELAPARVQGGHR